MIRAAGNIEDWDVPDYLQQIPPGWTQVNRTGDEPYLNYCRDCGWASDVALWFTNGGPFCPRCKSDQVGRLSPKDESG